MGESEQLYYIPSFVWKNKDQNALGQGLLLSGETLDNWGRYYSFQLKSRGSAFLSSTVEVSSDTYLQIF